MQTTHHLDDFGVDRFGEYPSARGNVLDELVEGAALNLLALEIRDRIHEIESHAALSQLPDEQLLLLRGRDICREREREKRAF